VSKKVRHVPDQLDGILFAERIAIAGVQAHAAETDRRNFQVAPSKFALLHCCPPRSVPSASEEPEVDLSSVIPTIGIARALATILSALVS
jgi:hypothetical protein